MSWPFRKIIFNTSVLLSLLFLFSGITRAQTSDIYKDGWIDFNKNGTKDIYEDPSRELDERIDDLLSRMNLKEKTSQMATLYGYGRVLADELPQPYWKDTLWQHGIGNIDEHLNNVAYHDHADTDLAYPHSLHAKSINKVQRFFVEETRLGIPVDFTNEGIRGLCHEKATGFPSQIGVGSTWNTDLVQKIGHVTGSEARALGYTNIYSPILDLARDQRWGRIVETYGEDPYLVSQMGKTMVKALQNENVVSTPKHFAVYSAPKGGRDANSRTDPHVTRRAMETLFLAPFEAGIKDAGAMGVMSSYNDYNGIPISGSSEFLTDILRTQWGFGGYVVSDSRAVGFMHSKHQVAETYKEAVRKAVMAGVNIRTDFTPPSDYVEPLRELVRSGEVPMNVINSRVRDILRVKFKLGLFDQPYVERPERADQIVRSKEHQAVSLQAARESIVLLKNDKNRLPLEADKLNSVLVTGPLATDTYNAISRYGPSNLDPITTLEGIRNKLSPRGISVRYTKGADLIDGHYPKSEVMDFPISDSAQAQIDAAKAMAKETDLAIVVVGESEMLVGEARSRTSLDLPGNQLDLVQAIHSTGTPVVAVLINGRPLSINWMDKNIPAIVEAWFPGEKGGRAVADVLFGDYNPGGKLPVTVPQTSGQIPFNFPHKKGSQNPPASWGWLEVNPHVANALYPFGYGLSYTSFSYSDLTLSKNIATPNDMVTVSFKITNTGDRKGDEIPHMYITDQYSSVVGYEKMLKGFDRISLAPGETKQVEMNITPEKLAILDKEMNWTVEPGEFIIQVGRSSKDIRLRKSLQIAGETKQRN